MVFGLKKETEAWHIGIQHPRKPEKIIASLDVRDKAVATSGDYQRYFIKDKVRFHHILNPKDGWPENRTMSATVIADTVMDADALSTGVMVLGPTEGFELMTRLDDTEGLIVTKEGDSMMTPGIKRLTS